MKKSLMLGILSVAALLTVASANAGVLYSQVTSGTYGQASGYTDAGYAAVNFSTDGTTARLITYTTSPAGDYNMWYGDIPASAVTAKGINSIAVQLDTCSVVNSVGCGYVNVVIKMDPKGYGFVTDGSVKYDWGNVIVVVAGPTQVRESTITGTVNGITMDGVRSFIGKYTQSSITIQTAK